MTATLKGERIDRRDGTRSLNGPRSYRRVFLVETSSPQDGVDIVLAATGLPRLGTPYATDNENDFEALVNETTPVQLPKIDCLWEVTVTYTTGPESDEEDDDPLLRPPDVTWGFETLQIIATRGVDQDGKDIPILVSNGEPFDPPPMIEHSRQVLTVSRNERTIDPTLFFQFQNGTNDAMWLGAEERTVKIKGIGAVKVTDAKDPDNKYWRVTYIFVYEDEGWDITGVNQGTFFIDVADGNKKKAFLTEEGQPRLGLLNGGGGALDDDEDPTFSEPVFRNPQDFQKLGLEALILDQLQNRIR